MIKKVSKKQAQRLAAQGAREIPPLRVRKQAEQPQAAATDTQSTDLALALAQLSDMFQAHLQRFDGIVSVLEAENKALRAGQESLRAEMKALRERAVRLRPVRGSDGLTEYIDVVPIQKKTPRSLN